MSTRGLERQDDPAGLNKLEEAAEPRFKPMFFQHPVSFNLLVNCTKQYKEEGRTVTDICGFDHPEVTPPLPGIAAPPFFSGHMLLASSQVSPP